MIATLLRFSHQTPLVFGSPLVIVLIVCLVLQLIMTYYTSHPFKAIMIACDVLLVIALFIAFGFI